MYRNPSSSQYYSYISIILIPGPARTDPQIKISIDSTLRRRNFCRSSPIRSDIIIPVWQIILGETRKGSYELGARSKMIGTAFGCALRMALD
jgi:hypothetical protein